MSIKDSINLEIGVATKAAIGDIKNLEGHLLRVNKLAKETGDKTGISGGDLDKMLSNIQKLLQDAGKVRSGMEKDFNVGKGVGLDKEGKNINLGKTDLKKGLDQFNGEIKGITSAMAKSVNELTRRSDELKRMKTPRSKTPGGPTWGDRPFPEDVDLKTREAQRDKQKVTSRVTSSVSGLQRAADSKQLSYKQAEILEGNIREVYLGSTGAKPEHYEDIVRFAAGETDGEIKGWSPEPGSPLYKSQKGIKESSSEIHSSQDKLHGIRGELSRVRVDGDGKAITDGEGNAQKVYPEGSEERNQLLLAEDKTLEELKKQQKLREEHKNLLTEIVDGINRLEKARNEYVKQTGSTDIKRSAEEGTFEHAVASRANAIALSMGTALAFSIKNAIGEGKSIVEGQRDESLRIGFNTGNYDFRGIRKEARSSGTHMGYTGDDMLAFEQSVMGSMGYTSETAGVTAELARADKFSGADEGRMMSLFESSLRTGSVESADEARDLTDMITGSINASKMSGRADEHVATLEAILDEQATGRAMSSEETKAQIAMMSILSGTGNKALQGENLQQNLGSLQANIAATDPYSLLGFHMGVGTDPKYTGEGGLFNVKKETAKGLGSQDVIEGFESIIAQRGRGAALDIISEMNQFAGVSPDAIEEIVDLLQKGELSADQGGKLQQQLMDGAETLAEAQAGYEESGDKIAQENVALKEGRKANTADNKMVDVLSKMDNIIEAIGADSTAGAFAVTGAKGLAIAGATGALGAASIKAMTPFLKGVGTTIKSVFGLGGVEAAATATKGGLGSKAMGGLKTAGTAVSGKLTGIGEAMLPGLTGDMASNILGKGLMTRAVIDSTMGAYRVATADRKGAEAVSQTGDVGGGLAGAWAGMKLGALGGTAVGGPLGTIIGGGAGMLAGGMAGSGIGKSIGDWAAGKWFGGTDEQHAAGYEEQQSIAENQQDVVTTSSKESVESSRSENIHKESQNLSEWDRLVNEIRNLLEVARRQNGIIGNKDGLSSFSSGGVGAGGELGAVGEGKYWTSSNMGKHDITKTSSELTSEQLDAWISGTTSSNSKMIGMGSAFMEAGNKHGIDPRMLVGLAGHESDWGRSDFAQNRNNFFGMNANTNSPGDAFKYGSPEESIMDAADRIRKYYVEEGRTNLDSMGSKYADDPLWSQKVGNTMKDSERYTSPSKGELTVNTTVNLNSTGNTKRDAETIAKRSADRTLAEISKMYNLDMANYSISR